MVTGRPPRVVDPLGDSELMEGCLPDVVGILSREEPSFPDVVTEATAEYGLIDIEVIVPE